MPQWRRTLRDTRLWWAVLYIAIFAGFGSLFMLLRDPGYRVGQFVSKPIVSRVAFETEDQDETAELRETAYDNQPSVYRPNTPYITALSERLNGLISVGQATSLDEVPEQTREQLKLTPDVFATLKNYMNGDEPDVKWQQTVQRFFSKLFALPILNQERFNEQTKQLAAITILNPFPENKPEEVIAQTRYPVQMISVSEPEKLNRQFAEAAEVFPVQLRPAITSILSATPQATYILDPELTLERREAAAAAVAPYMEKFKAGQVLVAAGSELKPRDLQILEAELAQHLIEQPALNDALRRVGTIGSVLIIAIALWLYLWAYKPRVIENPMRGLALTTVLTLGLGAAIGLYSINPAYLYFSATLPTLVVVAILTISYDQRFALGIGVLHAGLVMLSLGLDPAFGLVLFVGVGMLVWQIDTIRTRSKLVRSGAVTGLSMAVATIITALAVRPLQFEPQWTYMTMDVGLALFSGVTTGILVQAILPGLEKLFKVTTAMTLKELNDASHPLLQRLAHEAPGTYQHSLRIADMAEAAAESIGGDGLLCRVGAMYHDIGKTNKPQYFIENQGGGPNKHNKLSPAMSLLIIVGHVKDGMEMAREYALPTCIRHFIESHHGTTLVEYFYHAAMKQKQAEDKPLPSEFEFRYPGPKPQSREAAILLLCDSLEAAARALPDPTPVRLEQLVEKIATKRLMDGQFDECEMTLADLHKIETSITKTLCAIYHARIKYPAGNSDNAKPQANEDANQETETPSTPQAAAG